MQLSKLEKFGLSQLLDLLDMQYFKMSILLMVAFGNI